MPSSDWFTFASESAVHGRATNAEDVTDLRHGHVLLFVEAPRSADLVRRETRRTTTSAPSSTGRREAGVRALADQVPFKLGQCGEDMEHEPTAGRGGVDGLLQRPETAPSPSAWSWPIGCRIERPRRSRRQTTSVSPGRS